MQNHVDTSEKTVQREWARIEHDYKVAPTLEVDDVIQAANDDTIQENGTQTQDSEPEGSENSAPQMALDEKRELTKAIIARTAKATTEAVGQITLPEHVTNGLGEAYADLILKYFPEMGVFGLLEKYKVEIAAVTATASFAFAFRKAKNDKRTAFKQQAAANDSNNQQTGQTA